MNLSHLTKRRMVTNRTWHHGINGIFWTSANQNPKYGDLKFDDPRMDEQWEQKYITHDDIYRDLFKRIEQLEKSK